MDIFKKILDFYGEIMPRAKKKTVESPAAGRNNVNESSVATLLVNILEVYKNNCKSELLSFQDLERGQLHEVANLLDVQESIIKASIFEQVDLLFK